MLNMPTPNLFIIGAMKSGTSTLHTYLSKHPSIFMSRLKEPSYFVSPEQLRSHWPSMWEKELWRNQKNYLDLFKEAESKEFVGESSTTYTKRPQLSGVARRIFNFNPKAKFIYIMRDPVERTISHYWHRVNWEGERRSPLKAIEEDTQYCDVSYYKMQLEPYFELAGANSVFCLTFERFVNNPLEELNRILCWLNVDSDFQPKNQTEKENITPEQIHRVKGYGILQRFRYSKVWDAIGPKVPENIRRWARSFSDPPIHRKTVPMDEVIHYLRLRQLSETEELCKLLNTEFIEWKTLYGN